MPSANVLIGALMLASDDRLRAKYSDAGHSAFKARVAENDVEIPLIDLPQ